MLYTKSSFQFEDGGSEGTPPSGSWELYFDSAGGHIKSYEGVVSDLGGGGGGLQFLRERRQDNYDIFLGPSGNGQVEIGFNQETSSLQGTAGYISLHADKITNSYTGQNIFSTGSVDLQFAKDSEGGEYTRPTAGGNYSTVLGGSGNYIDPSSENSAIIAGSKNQISYGAYSFIGCGRDNVVLGSGPLLDQRVHDVFVIGESGVARRDAEFVRSKGRLQASYILSSAYSGTSAPGTAATLSGTMPLSNGISKFDIDILGSNEEGTVYYGSKIHGICTTTGIIRQFVSDEFYTGYTGAFGSEVEMGGSTSQYLQIKASGGANMHWWADAKILEGVTRFEVGL